MDSEKLLTSFKQQFENIVPGIDWSHLNLEHSVHIIPKDDYLFQQGDNAQRVFCLYSGLVRYVNLSEEGREFTQVFVEAPRIIGSTRAMMTGEPVQFGIQALEDCQIISFPWREFFQQMEKDNAFLKAYIHFLEGIFIREQDNRKSLERDSAETRYLNFCAENPTLLNRIPLQLIATYLSITPVALSRIRSKLKNCPAPETVLNSRPNT